MAANHLIEVYKTSSGVVYQNNALHQYILDFGGSTAAFRVSDFFHFHKQVAAINIAEMAENPSRTADFVILMPHSTDRCFLLTLKDVVALRELLNGAKFMINLNSMIHECLHVNLVPSYLD